ncbi:substrate-binding domain-containing protein [Rhodococcus sp. NPDC058521]|uniref:substrate-binding domain-containing protein n=1 Tax=Rhodococcus sp. NPDC058521 TaxID=3346536 RepID=UPI0036533F83
MTVGRHSRVEEPRHYWGFYALCAVVVVGLVVSAVVVVRAVQSWTQKCDGTEEFTLAASPSIAPALNSILDDGDPDDAGCATFAVSAATEGEISGRLGKGDDAPDLWIPDSGTWVRRAGLTATGPVEVVTGSVATTPIVVAGRKGETPTPVTWLDVLRIENLQLGNPLTTGVAGGPILSALAEGQSDPVVAETVRSALVPLAQEESQRLADEPVGIEMLERVSANGGVAVATEQEMIEFAGDDTAMKTVGLEKAAPETAGALEAAVPKSGTTFMNYPLVVTAPSPKRHYIATAVARELAALLDGDEARKTFADNGFRDVRGEPLDSNLDIGDVAKLELRDESIGDEALGAWALMALPIRTLVAIDVSGSMASPAGNETRMDLTVQAALAGNAMFPDSVSAGLWAFSQGLGGEGRDYLEMVPIRRYDTDVDGRPQRQVMADQANEVTHLIGGGTGLYDTTLAAFRTVQASYDPRAVNSVIILTDGSNEDPDSITKEQLMDTLVDEQDPARPVIVVTIGITDDADAKTLAEISLATGGSSYVAKNPVDIANVFVNALSDRAR